jgi:hypothetical protein
MGVSVMAVVCMVVALLSWVLATTGTAVWYARAFSRTESPPRRSAARDGSERGPVDPGGC